MSRIMKVVVRLGFAAAIVGGLAFGASQALATTAQRECSLCDWPDPQGLCMACCIELDFQGGDCWPSGNCLCY